MTTYSFDFHSSHYIHLQKKLVPWVSTEQLFVKLGVPYLTLQSVVGEIPNLAVAL